VNVEHLRTWAEIDLAALCHNTSIARSLAGTRQLMAVVKADAYGHGVTSVIHSLVDQVDLFGVSGLKEAQEIREAGIQTPVFLLSVSLSTELSEICDLENIIVTISSLEEAKALSSTAARKDRCIKIHCVIDTGMGRIGFLPSQWEKALVTELRSLPNIKLTGIMSHLPSADEDEAFTRQQIKKFHQLAEKTADLDAHIVNSAGLIGYREEAIGNMVRPGLLLYGTAPIAVPSLDLKPVMSLKSRVMIVRDLPKGSGISYGRRFITEKSTKVATVGIGYGDGYRRELSWPNGVVLIRGVRCHVLGRVTMDQIMVDVTDLNGVSPGEEVLLFGQSCLGSHGMLSVEEVAKRAGLIPWEIFTGITPRVDRIYTSGNLSGETS